MLRLTLTPLDDGHLRPGQVASVRLEAVNASPTTPVSVAGLDAGPACVETVDTGRVDKRYVASWPAGAASSSGGGVRRRAAVRDLWAPPPALVVSTPASLPPGGSRAWTLRVRIPPGGPPSFAGAAARYRWGWRARARWAPGAAAPAAAGDDGGGSADAAHPPPPPLSRSYGWQEAAATPATFTVLPPAPAAPPPAGAVAAGPGVEPRPPAAAADLFAGRGGAAGVVEVSEGSPGEEGTRPGAPRGQWRPAARAASEGGGARLLSLSPAGAAPPTPTPSPLPTPPRPSAFSLRVAGADSPPITLTLHAPPDGSVSPGATLTGRLDFRALHEEGGHGRGGRGCPRCVFWAVALECVEAVSPAWAPGRGAGGSDDDADGEGDGVPAAVVVADEVGEAAAHTLTTHFSLCLPPALPPSLATPLVRVRWRLRFEFCCSAGGSEGEAGAAPARRGWFGGGGAARPPPPPPLVWTLPLLVLPPAAPAADECARE